MNWTPDAYDRLERAIAEGSRIRVLRRGSELVLLPEGLKQEFGGEVLVARHPVTGERSDFVLDDLEGFSVLD